MLLMIALGAVAAIAVLWLRDPVGALYCLVVMALCLATFSDVALPRFRLFLDRVVAAIEARRQVRQAVLEPPGCDRPHGAIAGWENGKRTRYSPVTGQRCNPIRRFAGNPREAREPRQEFTRAPSSSKR